MAKSDHGGERIARREPDHSCDDSSTVAAISGAVIYHQMETGDYMEDRGETMPEYLARQLSLLRASLEKVRP